MTKRITGDAADPEDPWALAQTNGYSIDNFYTRSTDGRGHSENVQAKLSPAMIGEINALVHSRELPGYKTVQDFIRDACVHRAKYVSDLLRSSRINELNFGGIIAAEAMIAQIEQNAAKRALGQQVLDRTANEIKELLESNKKSDAWDRVEEFAELAEAWHDETVYVRMVDAIESWREQLTTKPRALKRIK